MSAEKKAEESKPAPQVQVVAAAAPAKPAPPGPPPGAPSEPAIKLPQAPAGQTTLRVNGKDHFIDPKKYRVLIEALHDLGYGVPHFCYHPGLEPDGNCRMCYVHLIDLKSGKPMMGPNLATQPWSMYPKPTISCRQPIDPRGMVVETENEELTKARKWVMEFLLINHPLDCPVCDKAGECMLQDNSFDHGQADSRFQERKREIPRKELGPTIDIWTDRCITCTRCTRFLDEVPGSAELYVSERGDRSEISIMPGHPVNNPLMGNIVDLCPVGALIDKDLMYTYRAWYLQKTDSLCPGCSKGCNIEVQAEKEYLRRLVPRENREVNGWWICDMGRKDFQYVHCEQRVGIHKPGEPPFRVLARCEEAGQRLAKAAAADPASVAALVSAWLTLEELHTLRVLFRDTFKSEQVGLLALPDWPAQRFKKFTIEADRNPNRAGARLVFGEQVEAQTAQILGGIESGAIKALYLVSSMPHYEPEARLLAALGKLELLVVQDLLQGPLTAKASVVLPGSSFAEKDGVFLNGAGRAQVLRSAIDPIAEGNNDLAVLQRVSRAAGAEAKLLSAREVFRRMAEEYPRLRGLSHQGLGVQGSLLAAAGGVSGGV